MLKEFLQSIAGPASNVAFTYPSSNGFGGPSVTPQGVFTKLLNVLSNGGGSSNNFLGTYNTMQAQQQNPAAVQAYLNSLNNYGVVSANSKKQEAFSPGSVISNLQAPPIPQQGFNPYSQLAGAINPLQGFAGQSSATATGAIPGAVGTFGAGGLIPGQVTPGAYGMPGGFSMPGAGGFGKWSMFLMPLISLIGLMKSFFGFGRGTSSMKPVQIDKDALDYKVSLQNYERDQRTDGSFDETSYWGEGEEGESGFDSSKLEI